MRTTGAAEMPCTMRASNDKRITRLSVANKMTRGIPATRPKDAVARIPGDGGGNADQTLRVATAGGTREARVAGPSTASWPSSHRQAKPIGT